MKLPQGGFQATDASERRIQVIFHDAVNDALSEPIWIKRAQLSKFYYLSRVIGSKNGLFIVELNHEN